MYLHLLTVYIGYVSEEHVTAPQCSAISYRGEFLLFASVKMGGGLRRAFSISSHRLCFSSMKYKGEGEIRER